jgi:hypothetical protein
MCPLNLYLSILREVGSITSTQKFLLNNSHDIVGILEIL